MIKTFFNTAKRNKLTSIEQPRHGSWIHVSEATNEDLENLLKITELTLADIDDSLDTLETPRIERHGEEVILFVRQPINGSHTHTETLTIILTNQYFITISPSDIDFLEDFLTNDSAPATTQTTKLLLLVLLKLTHKFTKEVKSIRNTVLSQEKSAIEAITDKDIVNLIYNEEILNQYLSALTPMRNVFETLLLKQYIKFHEDDSDLLEDLLISIRQSVDVCQVNLNTIQNLRDSYQIIFTNRLNSAIQRLTVLTIMLTIPTILASLFGMNVQLPFENNPYIFAGILIFSISIAICIYLLVRAKRWL